MRSNGEKEKNVSIKIKIAHSLTDYKGAPESKAGKTIRLHSTLPVVVHYILPYDLLKMKKNAAENRERQVAQE